MRALVLVALLCVGTVHALDDTCSTLWSKLSHLGCRPQDQPLRNHLDTLTLADGGVVTRAGGARGACVRGRARVRYQS